jgi:hypothetical protein
MGLTQSPIEWEKKTLSLGKMWLGRALAMLKTFQFYCQNFVLNNPPKLRKSDVFMFQ